jgi:hypothetical protein
MAQRSRMYPPSFLRPSSTSLTLDELMSSPSSGADWRPNKDPKEIKPASCNALVSRRNVLKIPHQC